MKVAVKLCYIAPYVLALGAIANNVTTSLYLDLRAVVAFRCGAIYMPLVWGLLGVFPALFAMVAAWRQHGFFKPSMWPFSRCKSEANDAITSQSWAAWAHQAMSVHRRRRSQWLSDLVFSAAAIASILQLIFGTSLLSAMTPVFYWDALPIITRYAISTLVCRGVMLVELEMMRLELREGRGLEASPRQRQSSPNEQDGSASELVPMSGRKHDALTSSTFTQCRERPPRSLTMG